MKLKEMAIVMVVVFGALVLGSYPARSANDLDSMEKLIDLLQNHDGVLEITGTTLNTPEGEFPAIFIELSSPDSTSAAAYIEEWEKVTSGKTKNAVLGMAETVHDGLN